MAEFLDLPREVLISQIVMRKTFQGGENTPESCACSGFVALVHMRCLNKAWHAAISSTLEYQCLRLVEADLKDLHSWEWILNDPHQFLLTEFPRNLRLLERSRRLTVRVAPRIVVAALESLTAEELVILRNALCCSWLDIDVLSLKEETEDQALWITPGSRVKAIGVDGSVL